MGSEPDVLGRLAELRRRAALGGGEARLQRLRESGRLTARERIEGCSIPAPSPRLDALVTHRCRDFGMGGTSGCRATASSPAAVW